MSKKYELVKCPLRKDRYGVLRFQENRVVSYLLENCGINMNNLVIASVDNKWSKEEMAQFSQLIGYSLDGWRDLSCVTKKIDVYEE